MKLPEAGENSSPASRPKPLEIDAPEASGKTPHRLNIPDQVAPAAPERPVARTLAIQETVAAPAPRRMNIPDQVAPPQSAPPIRASAPLPQHNPLIEQLVAKAQEIEPSIRPERIKGRIDVILASSLTDLLDFGQRNLTPLQNASARQSKIMAEVSRIDAAGWIEQTKDASCKRPGFMDRFTTKPPHFYEGMLQKARAELIVFTRELEQAKKDFFREISDLHLDAVAMLVCAQVMSDDHSKMTADNRGRTLLQAHQTAAIVQTTIEQAMLQCAQFVQTIDQLLSVTIPAWKAAHQNP